MRYFVLIGLLLCHCVITASYGLANHVSISRTVLKSSKIITLVPKGWLLRSVKYSSKISQNCVKEILYFPSVSCLNCCDSIEYALDDEHFCSLLVDKGYAIHLVTSLKGEEVNLNEILSWKINHSYSNSISTQYGLICHELSVPKILRSLSLQYSERSYFDNIGAIVVIDSPPLNSLYDFPGRVHILEKYFQSYNSIDTYKEHLQLSNLSVEELTLKWQSYRDRINHDSKLAEYFKLLIQEDKIAVKRKQLQSIGEYEGSSQTEANRLDSELQYYYDVLDKTEMKQDFNYDKEVHLAQIRQKLSKRKQSKLYLNSHQNPSLTVSNSMLGLSKDTIALNDKFILAVDDIDDPNRVVNDLTLLGLPPTRGIEIGKSLPHRILVLSSYPDDQDEMLDNDDEINVSTNNIKNNSILSETSNDFTDYEYNDATTNSALDAYRMIDSNDKLSLIESLIGQFRDLNIDNYEDLYSTSEYPSYGINMYSKADEWGFESANEVAARYSAGAVISVHPSQYIHETETFDRSSNHNDEITDNEITSRDSLKDYKGASVWTKCDISRHDYIANTINDWLRLLSSCGYLPG